MDFDNLPDAYWLKDDEITETADFETAVYMVSLYGGQAFRTHGEAVKFLRGF